MMLLDEHLAALRHHSHRALENIDKKSGWARACSDPTPHPTPWRWHHLDDLVKAGLMTRSEDYMDVWLKPTDEGWALLASLPELPD